MRRPAVALVAAAFVVVLAGCESNIDRSSKIAAQGGHSLTHQAGLKVTAAAGVRVLRTAIVSANGANAVAVQLRNEGKSALAALPIALTVKDAAGKTVYTNTAAGLQPELQRVNLIGAGQTVWWVDDQVTATGPRTATVVVGAGKAVAKPPVVTAQGAHLDDSGISTTLVGTLRSTGAPAASAAVYAISLRGAKVVAAGRAIVPSLAGSAPAKFTAFFVGDPKGTTPVVSVLPATATNR